MTARPPGQAGPIIEGRQPKPTIAGRQPWPTIELWTGRRDGSWTEDEEPPMDTMKPSQGDSRGRGKGFHRGKRLDLNDRVPIGFPR